MEICRYSTQPNANAFIDCIYHVIIQPSTLPPLSYPLLYPCQFTPPPCRCDTFQHLTTHLDAFRQVWHILRYIYFEQDGTDSNICNRNGVKMVTSDLSARINDVLRYVGITRNMNAYMILSQALTLIAENEGPPASRRERDLHAHCRQNSARAQSSPEHGPPGIQGRMGFLPRSRTGAGWLSFERSPICCDHA